MTPTFWKLSQGPELFDYEEFLESIYDKLVYVHKNARAKGRSNKAQAQEFIEARIGDYFYLTYGNQGIYLLGQFTGPANILPKVEQGWIDRPYRLIRYSNKYEHYNGPKKWWTPNDLSTFANVKQDELALLEELILQPFFGIKLSDYGIRVSRRK